jgi:outer membrane protein TolC
LSYLSFPNVNFAPQNIWNVGLLVQCQPFDWGQKRHRAAQEQAAVQQSSLAQDDASQRFLADVGAAFRKLSEARALLDARSATQEAAKERLRVLMNRYEQKAVVLSDVLEQQAALEEAVGQFREAIASYWLAKTDFNRAIGRD